MITVRGETNELFIQGCCDIGLRNNALDEDTAIASHKPPEFDKDMLASGLRFGQRVGQARMPRHGALVVKMRMRIRHS